MSKSKRYEVSKEFVEDVPIIKLPDMPTIGPPKDDKYSLLRCHWNYDWSDVLDIEPVPTNPVNLYDWDYCLLTENEVDMLRKAEKTKKASNNIVSEILKTGHIRYVTKKREENE